MTDEYKIRYIDTKVRDIGGYWYHGTYWVEQRPRCQKIYFGSQDIWLNMPWLYATVVARSLSKNEAYDNKVHPKIMNLFLSPKRIYDCKDPLYRVPLPNMYMGIRPCVASHNFFPVTSFTPKDIIGAAFIALWGKAFNTDYLGCVNSTPAWKTLAKKAHEVYNCNSRISIQKILQAWETLEPKEVRNLPFSPRGTPKSALELKADFKLCDRKIQ